MANILPQTMEKVQHAVLGPRGGDKVSDLGKNTKEMTNKMRLTTDYGVKQTTADDWLKAVDKDQAGPLLLEDPFARERVCNLTFGWASSLWPYFGWLD
jgi:catalase